MVAPARRAAYRALRAVQSGQRDPASACAEEDAALSDARDRGLLREIVTGTLRWQRRLDFLIAHVANRDTARLDAEVLTILELSAYQLLHLTRVPASAVVDDAVTLTRGARKTSAAGFVNGVLRSLSRQRGHLPLPARPGPSAPRAEVVAWLGLTYAHPDWLVERWVDRMGVEDAEAWLRFNTDTPVPVLRHNALAGSVDALQEALRREDVAVHPGAWAPGAFVVEHGDPQAVVASGLAMLQDEASQLVAALVEAAPGDRVLDVCAAPGGKSTAIAPRLGDAGLLVACDIRPRRLRTLASAVRTARAGRIRLVQIDAR
ncbi:MAG: transcription antitermination factor NusB, partial [Vicinamibacterales bacterium]